MEPKENKSIDKNDGLKRGLTSTPFFDLLDAIKLLRENHSITSPHHEDLCAICIKADRAILKAQADLK